MSSNDAPSQFQIREQAGTQTNKVIYESNDTDRAPINVVDRKLNQKLCGVMQSLDTNGYFQISRETGLRETTRELKKR
jgi:hypothetical protein